MKFPTPKKGYSNQVTDAWQKRRERGDSCDAIGDDYGLSGHVIRANTNLKRAVVTDEMASEWQSMRDRGYSLVEIAGLEDFSLHTVSKYTTAPVSKGVPAYRMSKMKASDFTKEFPITVGGEIVGYFKPKGDDNEL